MGCREQEAPVDFNLACLPPSSEMTAGCLPMGVGNAEVMVKGGGGVPWKLGLVERIEKQEVFEVGHLSHCSARQPPSAKPQPTPP